MSFDKDIFTNYKQKNSLLIDLAEAYSKYYT